MNIWVSAALTTSPSEAYAIRKRLMGKPQREQLALSASPEAPAPKRQTFLQVRLPADAHIWAWAQWKQRMTMSGKEYILSRCADFRISVEMIMSPSQKPEAVWYRDQLIYEIRTHLRPQRSWAQIGRLFGRDHTSAIAACRRAAARTGDTVAQAYVDLKHRRSAESHQREKARALG